MQKKSDLLRIIVDKKLKTDETMNFVDISFRDGAPKTTGKDIDTIFQYRYLETIIGLRKNKRLLKS